MKKVIATSRPIRHGDKVISKSVDSLNKLLSLDSLDIVNEHDGNVIGKVTNFMLRVKNGITEVLADIPNSLNTMGKGFSLQFTGQLLGDTININSYKHLALTANPRDVFTFSESATETEVTATETVEEPAKETVEDPKPEQLTSDQLIQLLDNPDIQKRLLGLLNVSVEKEEPAKETKAEEVKETKANTHTETKAEDHKEDPKPEAVQPIRVVVKPAVTPLAEKPKEKPQFKVKQFKFPSI